MVNVVVEPWLIRADTGLMLPLDPADVDTGYWFKVKLAVTMQGPVMVPVVKVLPIRLPPQPFTVPMLYPVFGLMVNVVVEPWLTNADVGFTLPPVPAVAVTVYWFRVKLAVTVHGPVMVPVVNVLPTRLPPQPLTTPMLYPVFGLTVKVVVDA